MRILTIIAAATLTAIYSTPAFACPTCKGALHENGVATGYAISILVMMGMPFLIAAFWTVVIIRMRKRMQIQASPQQFVQSKF